jgi:hypothetical protein
VATASISPGFDPAEAAEEAAEAEAGVAEAEAEVMEALVPGSR